MSIISKICVLFLVWMLFGIAACFSVAIKYQLKVNALVKQGGKACQKKYEEYGNRELDDFVGNAYGFVPQDEKPRGLDILPYFMIVGIIWPISVNVYDKAFRRAYERAKAEMTQSKE